MSILTHIIPTIHPAALLRSQDMQLAVLADLRKAVRVQATGPTLIPACYRAGAPMPPWSMFPDCDTVLNWLEGARGMTISLDLESTYKDQIMCMGLWPTEGVLDAQGICIPFYQRGGGKYWGNPATELRVMAAVFNMLRDPETRIVGQNIVGFDIPLMRRVWGVETAGLLGDTMVAHALVMPEMRHGLAFLSSMFTDLSPYKIEVHEGGETEEKDDTNKWENVLDYDDRKLREYCLLDTFATALVWNEMERMMS